jgi:hypothetical protein
LLGGVLDPHRATGPLLDAVHGGFDGAGVGRLDEQGDPDTARRVIVAEERIRVRRPDRARLSAGRCRNCSAEPDAEIVSTRIRASGDYAVHAYSSSYAYRFAFGGQGSYNRGRNVVRRVSESNRSRDHGPWLLRPVRSPDRQHPPGFDLGRPRPAYQVSTGAVKCFVDQISVGSFASRASRYRPVSIFSTSPFCQRR